MEVYQGLGLESAGAIGLDILVLCELCRIHIVPSFDSEVPPTRHPKINRHYETRALSGEFRRDNLAPTFYALDFFLGAS